MSPNRNNNLRTSHDEETKRNPKLFKLEALWQQPKIMRYIHTPLPRELRIEISRFDVESC